LLERIATVFSQGEIMKKPTKKNLNYAAVGLGHIAQVAVLPAFRQSKNSWTAKAGDQFAAELDYFSSCILENKKVETSGEEGLADLQVIEKTPHRKPELIHAAPESYLGNRNRILTS
jgi:predicted dehydrogenase